MSAYCYKIKLVSLHADIICVFLCVVGYLQVSCSLCAQSGIGIIYIT